VTAVVEDPGAPSAIGARVRRLDHLAIATLDMAEPVELFCGIFGARLIAGGDNDITGTRLMHLWCGGFKLELMQPLRPDSPLAPRLHRAGPGFHHITFVVNDVVQTIDDLAAAGLETVGTDLGSPRWRETFLPPARTFGTLIQLVDTTRSWDAASAEYGVADVLAGRVVWRDYVDCLR
jgi:catechol 2,3-dioxygenase-like lactoylglutathione lyase family enzyme